MRLGLTTIAAPASSASSLERCIQCRLSSSATRAPMCSSHSSTSARNAPSAPPSSRSVPIAALGCAGEVVGVVVGVDGGCRYGDADEAADASDGTGEVERRQLVDYIQTP